MKSTLSGLISIPIFALFLGAGILAWKVGDTWTEATTASLVTGLVAVCGGGAVVLALILSLVVGIPMASRYFFEAGVARQAWQGGGPQSGPGRSLPQWQEDRPPMIGGNGEGRFLTQGPATYDLWDGEEAPRFTEGNYRIE